MLRLTFKLLKLVFMQIICIFSVTKKGSCRCYILVPFFKLGKLVFFSLKKCVSFLLTEEKSLQRYSAAVVLVRFKFQTPSLLFLLVMGLSISSLLLQLHHVPSLLFFQLLLFVELKNCHYLLPSLGISFAFIKSMSVLVNSMFNWVMWCYCILFMVQILTKPKVQLISVSHCSQLSTY